MYYVDFKDGENVVHTVAQSDRLELEWMNTGFDILYWHREDARALEMGLAYCEPRTKDEGVLDFFRRLKDGCVEYPDAVIEVTY